MLTNEVGRHKQDLYQAPGNWPELQRVKEGHFPRGTCLRVEETGARLSFFVTQPNEPAGMFQILGNWPDVQRVKI